MFSRKYLIVVLSVASVAMARHHSRKYVTRERSYADQEIRGEPIDVEPQTRAQWEAVAEEDARVGYQADRDRGVKRFQALFKVGYYLPVVTSIVAIAVIWRFVLSPDNGLLNTVLGWVGIDGPNWLASKTWAMPSLIAMAVWRNFGSAMIIFLAGLQGIPESVEEAGQIDGAGPWQRFRYLILPLLRPTVLFTSVTTGIGYLQFFEEPFVMTQGGPLDSTVSVSMATYDQFGFGNYGLATSMAYILFVVIAVITFIQFRLLREK